MNKQELLENYTAEQIADMVIKAYEKENTVEQIVVDIMGFPKIYPIKEVEEIIRAYEGIRFCKEQNKECKTILPMEYLKVLTLNQIVDKKQKEINSLKDQLQRKETVINQIDDILNELFGVTHNIVDIPDGFKKILKDKIKSSKTIADFLPTEPIKVADMLINAEGEYERSSIEKAFCGSNKGTYSIFDISELHQIAEHLLVYCNANESEEEE